MISKRQQGSEEEIPHDEPSLSSSNNLTGPYLGAGSQTGESSPASTTVAGRNLLFEEIGRGGMGAVFKGRDTELGRELAVKVLLDDHRDRPELIRRFLEEAQIAGQLQHPGVAPVYELGRFPDNRPYFTMKLVQGHTLSELLRQRADIHQVLGKFLGIFAQVCQTVAYAHSQGVIHRDLKPSNIMVGGFGEVQVMDWGLAKVLRPTPGERTETRKSDGNPVVQTNGRGSTAEESQTGIVGTLAYMPPEQARGEPADERADVFSLGAILCEILTGRAVYTGSRQALWSKVQGVELGEAFTRLEHCGADAELIGLARRCLAANREERPRHAGEVAEAVGGYLAAVEARARQAEQERAAAAARAEEAKATAAAERRAKRMTVGLAVAGLLLVATGGCVAWIVQHQHAVALARKQEAERRAVDRMDQARVLLDAGWQANDLTKLADARANAEQATEIANGADESIREKAAQLHDEVKARIEATDKNRALLNALLEMMEPPEKLNYRKGTGGMMLPIAPLTMEEQAKSAFRRWDPALDIDRSPLDEIVSRFQAQPESVVQEAVSGLDVWAVTRKSTGRPDADWRRLFEIAGRLDHLDARRQLRRLIVEPSVETPTDAAEQSANIRAELKRLAGKLHTSQDAPLNLLILARVLETLGEIREAETLLRSAVTTHRNEASLMIELGKLLERQKPPRLGEAIEMYRAAYAVRPGLGVALGTALSKANRTAEGEAILRDLVGGEPDNPELRFYLADALHRNNKNREALAAYRKAIELKPDFAEAYHNLAVALIAPSQNRSVSLDLSPANQNQNDLRPIRDEAAAAFRKAIEIRPNYASAYGGLGTILAMNGQVDMAIANHRKAIEIDPAYAIAHVNLGAALLRKNRLDESIYHLHRALELDFRDEVACTNLGNALQLKGRVVEAIELYRKAIEIDPKYGPAHGALGMALVRLGRFAEGREEYRRCLIYVPKSEAFHGMTVRALQSCESLLALDQKLSAYLKSATQPGSAEEGLAMADMCARYRKRYRAAYNLYAAAFAARPKLAEDPRFQHRYNAACAAALAADGKGEDAADLDDKERARLRQQARDWLAADLIFLAKLSDKKDAKANSWVNATIQHWRSDPDLAALREPGESAKLTQTEREGWRKFWEEVEVVRKKASQSP